MQKYVNNEWIDCTDNELQTGDLYRKNVGGGGWQQQTYYSVLDVPLLNIVIDNITNTLSDFDDSDNEFTIKENTDCIATGKLSIPKQNFRVPFVRLSPEGLPDTKRYMVASVDELGNFTITLNFKTGGLWIVNTELLNSELPNSTFSIVEHKFRVV